jgi:hypothetical protein
MKLDSIMLSKVSQAQRSKFACFPSYMKSRHIRKMYKYIMLYTYICVYTHMHALEHTHTHIHTQQRDRENQNMI